MEPLLQASEMDTALPNDSLTTAPTDEVRGGVFGTLNAVPTPSDPLSVPIVPKYDGVDIGMNNIAQNGVAMERDALAAIEKQMKRLDYIRRARGKASLLGLIHMDESGSLHFAGSPLILRFIAEDDFGQRLASSPLHADAQLTELPLSFPVPLPALEEGWHEHGKETKKRILRAAVKAMNGGKKVVYTSSSPPPYWPAELRFASPDSAASLDPHGASGAGFSHLLNFAIAHIYRFAGFADVPSIPFVKVASFLLLFRK